MIAQFLLGTRKTAGRLAKPEHEVENRNNYNKKRRKLLDKKKVERYLEQGGHKK